MASLKFRLKKISEAKNYILQEWKNIMINDKVIKHNDVMREKHKKGCKALNCLKHFLTFISSVSVCVSNSAFISLVAVPVGITSSLVGIKIFAMTAAIKKFKSIMKKKEKKHDEILLLGKLS